MQDEGDGAKEDMSGAKGPPLAGPHGEGDECAQVGVVHPGYIKTGAVRNAMNAITRRLRRDPKECEQAAAQDGTLELAKLGVC